MSQFSLNDKFIHQMEQSLLKELPDKKAHLKMASRLRRTELRFSENTKNAILSSILILLYPRDNRVFTVMMLRQSYDGVHSGQVSFPGGRKEPEDKTLIETALRESEEEMNINPEKVKIIGTLSEMYIPPSNFLVLPVVGYSTEVPDFKPDSSEVAEIIETDLRFLFDPKLKKEKLLNVRGYEIEAPYYDVKGKVVWGATAMILSELHDVIERIR